MALEPGTQFGSYEIAESIGSGGMGEVYRATDTTLKREVAIKVLPEYLAADPERLARFQREAEVLASLNQPNIAQIFGIQKSDSTTALVMELVEGPTLEERIAQGPLPPDEALNLAMQIADALEAAHERGIVHRDLKPANIKLRSDGMIKVLDFGIAKALDTRVISGSDAPALTTPAMTEAGIVMGTAAYMSPEQARGKPVDQRADIWSFGCVLYEMLTGQLTFGGEDVAVVLARVLERGADTNALPATISPAVKHTIELCLEKDPKRRIADIRDVRLALQGGLLAPGAAGADGVGQDRYPWRGAVLIGTLALVVGVVVAGFATGALRPFANPQVIRTSINLSLDERLVDSDLALSPDGTTLAFSRRVGTSEPELCLRELDDWTIRCLAGTENARNPVFSPDGRRIAYDRAGELWSISSNGELPIRLSEISGVGATWGRGNSVIFNRSYNEGLWLIAEPGEGATRLTTPDPESGELGHFWPQPTPDENTVLFTIFRPKLSESEVAALRLDTGEIFPLFSDAVNARYVRSGHLLFVRANTLMAVPFDLARLQPLGTPSPVIDDIRITPQEGRTALSIGDHGTAVYVRESVANPERGLVWLDRQGNRETLPAVRGPLGEFDLSPDGRRLAVALQQANPDIFVFELASGRGRRLTSKEGTQRDPVWTPDGSRIAFASDEPPFDLFWSLADRSGTETLLRESPFDKQDVSFSPDGAIMVFMEWRPIETRGDLWILPVDAEQEPVSFLRTEFDERNAEVSPDGSAIAYQSNETGRFEIYVQSFPDPSGAQLVSTDGGTDPRWSHDGRSLFYRSQGHLVAHAINPGPPLEILQQERLFALDELGPYDVADDGRFLFVDFPSEIQPRRIDIVQNWFEELERLVPTE